MSTIQEQADRIESEATRLNWSVRRQEASTGTIYLHCERGSYRWVIRVAGHDQVYRQDPDVESFSVDPEQATVEEAIAALAEPACGVPGWKKPAKPQLTDSQKAAMAAKKRAETIFKENWKALRETLNEAAFDEFRRLGQSRATARVMAKARDVKVTQLWAALTNGKRWQ